MKDSIPYLYVNSKVLTENGECCQLVTVFFMSNLCPLSDRKSRMLHGLFHSSFKNNALYVNCFRLVLPNCGDPVRPNNTVVISTNHWAGGYVRYLCHTRYTMFGPAVRRCLSSGQWSGNEPTCESLLIDKT